MHQLLERYFGDQFSSGEWRCVSVLHYVENKSGRHICPTCEKFIVKPGELNGKLMEIENLVKHQRPKCNPNHGAGLVFTVLAVGQPLVTKSRMFQEMSKKITHRDIRRR